MVINLSEPVNRDHHDFFFFVILFYRQRGSLLLNLGIVEK